MSVVLTKVAEAVSGIEETYEGTKEFMAKHVHDIFSDKTVNFTDPHDGGIGISQNDVSVGTHNRIDLSQEEWFAFSDNFGTSEEKAFVAYFKDFAETLKSEYSKVFLVRNERQFHLYSFAGGERFEPDYVLFLQKDKVDGYEQLQIFIEPKRNNRWNRLFTPILVSLATNAIVIALRELWPLIREWLSKFLS